MTIEEIRIQFQGGFAGKLCRLETSEEKTSVEFYPEDVNVIQVSFPKLIEVHLDDYLSKTALPMHYGSIFQNASI